MKVPQAYWDSVPKNLRFKRTKLPDALEAEFQLWIKNTKWYRDITDKHKEIDLDNSDYDYRGAWLSGAVPDEGHWPSRTSDGRWLKSPDHPTAWMEVAYDMQNEMFPDLARW